MIIKLEGKMGPEIHPIVPFPICMEPIGLVKNRFGLKGSKLRRPKSGWAKTKSKIVLKSELTEALDGIEEYSHIVVVFWMDRVTREKRSLRKVHPYDLKDIPEKGVLAIRMRDRPNPIGVSIVELIERDRNVLEVRGLDAFNGTPVLDIKPYTGHPRDLVYDFRIPDWVKKFHETFKDHP